MGETWGKAKPNGLGGFKSSKDGYGTLHSTSVDSDGTIPHGNHVHFHNDGATIHKGGKTYTIYKSSSPKSKK